MKMQPLQLSKSLGIGKEFLSLFGGFEVALGSEVG